MTAFAPQGTARIPQGTLRVPQGTVLKPFAGRPFPPTIQNAFTADVCNYPWYTATTPSGQYFPSLNKTIQTWEAYVRGLREIHIKAYDHAAGTWSATYFVGNHSINADDHGVPSICQDNAGYFWVFGGAHATAMVFYRSNSINDITAFTEGVAIAGAYSYPHPNNVGGLIYLFMRKGGGGPDPRYLALYVGDPSSGTMVWGSEIVVGDFGAVSRWYLGTYIIVGTDIYMSATYADAADTYRQNVYLLIYNTLDGSVRNLSGTVTTPAASLPIGLTLANASYKVIDTNGTTVGSGNIPQICFDTTGQGIPAAGGNLHFAYMDGLFDAPFYYYHTMWDGSTFTTPYQVGQTGVGDLHRYDALTVAPNGSGGVDFACVLGSSTLASTRGGDMARATRSSAGVWSATSIVQRAYTYPLDACVMIRDCRPEYNIGYSQINYLQTIGVTGTESGLTQAYAIGNTVASPYIAASPYGPDVYNAIVRMNSDPGTTVKTALKTLVDFYRGTADVGLNGSGLRAWISRPFIYIFAGPDAPAALLNFRQNRFNLTVNGSPTFAGAYLGYTGAANAYFDTGQVLAGNFTGTSFSIQAAVKNNATTQSLVGTATGNDITLFWDGTTFTCKLGDSGAAMAPAFSATAGVVGVSRTGSAETAFGNGAVLATKTATNSAFQNNNVWINRRAAAYSVATFYAVVYGTYCSDAFMTMEAAALKTYLNTVSPGLLP